MQKQELAIDAGEGDTENEEESLSGDGRAV